MKIWRVENVSSSEILVGEQIESEKSSVVKIYSSDKHGSEHSVVKYTRSTPNHPPTQESLFQSQIKEDSF